MTPSATGRCGTVHPLDIDRAATSDAQETEFDRSPPDFTWRNGRLEIPPAIHPFEATFPRNEMDDGVVLMLLPRLAAANDWASAAAAAAPTVNAHLFHKASEPTASCETDDHLIRFRRRRPGRLLWRLNEHTAGRALVDAVDRLSASGHQVNLVHSHFFSDSPGLPYLLARRGIPYVVSEHSSAITSLNPAKKISPTGLKMASSLYRSASFVLPVSEFLAREIRRRGLPGELAVVPNPVDTKLFAPHRGDSGQRILCVARLDPVKRLDVLLRATAEVASTESNIHLDIVGDGPNRESLLDLAQSIGIADRTTFHGHVKRRDIPELLGRGSVFALSSYTENLPIAMLEALSCGLPVVGPNVGGVPEIVEGAPGAVFHPGDIGSLAAALRHWCDPSDRQRQAARDSALERYSIDAVGRRLRSVYQRAIE